MVMHNTETADCIAFVCFVGFLFSMRKRAIKGYRYLAIFFVTINGKSGILDKSASNKTFFLSSQHTECVIYSYC